MRGMNLRTRRIGRIFRFTRLAGLVGALLLTGAATSKANGFFLFNLFLHLTGGMLSLNDSSSVLGASLKFAESPGVRIKGGNPWKEVGTWSTPFDQGVEALGVFGNVNVKLGLKNSDDIGTRFDVRAEVWAIGKNGSGPVLVADGIAPCIAGITRNPNRAKLVTIPLNPHTEPVGTPAMPGTDELQLRILTRIGVTEWGSLCLGPGGSHSNAAGLRLYFGSIAHPSNMEFSLIMP
jgi:hypothetical protein